MADNIVDIPVEFKSPEAKDRFLKRVYTPECRHTTGPFLVDDTLMTVECGTCKKIISPVYVLILLANKETQWHLHREYFDKRVAELAERNRTKCDHCGKMTRISGAKS
jgi:ribosomal protein S27E